ncbi:hypothetical protein SAMN06272765_2829 [Streptomyces sp. Ag109_G2-15]|nr:hypothetical protein SAMN06272765_2829 [Streptomyces sp. Ag109_G2-15]
MMCDTSLMDTASGLRVAVQRPAGGRSDCFSTSLTCGNEESTKVIGKP